MTTWDDVMWSDNVMKKEASLFDWEAPEGDVRIIPAAERFAEATKRKESKERIKWFIYYLIKEIEAKIYAKTYNGDMSIEVDSNLLYRVETEHGIELDTYEQMKALNEVMERYRVSGFNVHDSGRMQGNDEVRSVVISWNNVCVEVK